jgi:YD repeat-containing protein
VTLETHTRAVSWSVGQSLLLGAVNRTIIHTVHQSLLLRGLPGADAAQVEFQASATHVQWRRVGAAEWTNLIALADIAGTDGDDGLQIELTASATHIQWRYAGIGASWVNLVAFVDLVPPLPGTITRADGLVTAMEIGSRIITIHRDENGIITGWEDATHEWTLTRDESGNITEWEVSAK